MCKKQQLKIMSSLDTFSLSPILCVAVITAILLLAVNKLLSNAADSTADKNVCASASCGIAEGEVSNWRSASLVNLLVIIAIDVRKTLCQSVRYHSEEYRKQQDERCKKQKAELHDKKLFSQPDSCHREECPICFLPLPIDNEKSTFYSCCSKSICNGCDHVHSMCNGGDNCPFCREPMAGKKETRKRMMKRVKANDPAALREMGHNRFNEGDYDGAFEYWTKAAELGDLEAHYQLGGMYWEGEGVEKEGEKAVPHLEKAAIRGHPQARHNLGYIEGLNGNFERAVKHLIIAANLGLDDSMKALWKHYSLGNIAKENLEATLRTHQAAVDEMKSPQRDAAEANKAMQKKKKKKNGRRG